MPIQWEYSVFKFKPTGMIFRGGNIDTGALARELNSEGRHGWEVAGVFGSSIGEGATNEVAIILKRPLERRITANVASRDEGTLDGAAMERAASRAVLRPWFAKASESGVDAITDLLAKPGIWDRIMNAEAWDLSPSIFRAARTTVAAGQETFELPPQAAAFLSVLPHSSAVDALERAIVLNDSDVRTLLTIARQWQLARYEFIRDVLRDGPELVRPRVLQLLSSTQRVVRPEDAELLSEIANLVGTPGRFVSLKQKKAGRGVFGTKIFVVCRVCGQEWGSTGEAPQCYTCNRDEFGFAERDLTPATASARAHRLADAIEELQELDEEERENRTPTLM